MKLSEILEGLAFGAKGGKIVKKFRCTTGKKAGRVVSKPSDCVKMLDKAKSKRLKLLKKKTGSKMLRKSMRTKRFSVLSKQIAKKNKQIKK